MINQVMIGVIVKKEGKEWLRAQGVDLLNDSSDLDALISQVKLCANIQEEEDLDDYSREDAKRDFYNSLEWSLEAFSDEPDVEDAIKDEYLKKETGEDIIDFLESLIDIFYDLSDADKMGQGCFIICLSDYNNTLYEAIEHVRYEDYNYMGDKSYSDIGEELTEDSGVIDILEEYNVLYYFDFEAYGKDMMTDYSYLEGYGYYMFY